MAPDEDLGQLTDEEYLIHRAKEQQLVDPCAAKCWMITAQALFPKNFGIQVQWHESRLERYRLRRLSFFLFHHWYI